MVIIANWTSGREITCSLSLIIVEMESQTNDFIRILIFESTSFAKKKLRKHMDLVHLKPSKLITLKF
jgi:hypothetical protein